MQLIDFIVCDDIRNEISGKNTLVGVYSDLIVYLPEKFDKFPVKMKLGFFIRIKRQQNDEVPNSFLVQFFQNGKKFEEMHGELKAPENVKNFVLSLIHGAFPIPNIERVDFKIILKKNDKVIWEHKSIYSLNVIVKNITN